MLNNFIKKILIQLLAAAGLGFGQITWESVDPPPQTDTLFSVTFGNDLFVAVGDSGTIITSPDGATWTQQHSGITTVVRSVSYCKDRFVAVGDSGKILSSTDGKTWASIPSGNSLSLRSSTYGNGMFLIVSWDGTTLTSLDGLTWSINPSVIGSARINSVTYGNGLFATAMDTAIWTSTDGLVWTCPVVYSSLLSICYCGNLFIATGANSTYSIFITSLDGIIWDRHWPGLGKGTIYTATYGNGQYVLIGRFNRKSAALVCADAISCTADFTDSPMYRESLCFTPVGWIPYSMTYGNNKFVAVGTGGEIVTGKADSLPNPVINPANFKTSLSPLNIILSNNGISFTVPPASLSGTLRVTILTIAGNKVFSSTAGTSNGNISIPLRGLSKGIYILSISDNRNRTVSSPFVLARR
jgi:hypothetical protein